MGKTSKNQNYFLISAVILGNILTCFTKPYNYTDRASFKHSFSLLFVHSTPAIQMLMQDQSHGQLMKTQTKTSRRQRKLSNPSRGRRSWKTDNLSSVVAQQSGKCPSASSREPQPHLQTKGDWKRGSCWEVRAQFRGFLWDQAAPTPGLWLERGEGDKGFTHHVFSLQGGVEGHRACAWLWAATRTRPLPSGSHTEGVCRL